MADLSWHQNRIRDGARGGQEQFNFDQVKNMEWKDRECYLGASAKIGTMGKMGQYRRDDWWHNKRGEGKKEDDKRTVREFEKEVMLEATGQKPKRLLLQKKNLTPEEMKALLDKDGLKKDHAEQVGDSSASGAVKGLGYASHRTAELEAKKAALYGVSDILEGEGEGTGGRKSSKGGLEEREQEGEDGGYDYVDPTAIQLGGGEAASSSSTAGPTSSSAAGPSSSSSSAAVPGSHSTFPTGGIGGMNNLSPGKKPVNLDQDYMPSASSSTFPPAGSIEEMLKMDKETRKAQEKQEKKEKKAREKDERRLEKREKKKLKKEKKKEKKLLKKDKKRMKKEERRVKKEGEKGKKSKKKRDWDDDDDDDNRRRDDAKDRRADSRKRSENTANRKDDRGRSRDRRDVRERDTRRRSRDDSRKREDTRGGKKRRKQDSSSSSSSSESSDSD